MTVKVNLTDRRAAEGLYPHGHSGWWRRVCTGAGLVSALAGLGTLAAAPANATTGLSNGSFETPVLTPNTIQRFFTGQSIGAWKVTKGDVDLIGAGFWQAKDGVQSLDLDGANNGTISQTFDTLPLVKYEVSYALAGNIANGPVVKTGQVLVNGRVVQNFSFDITGKSRTDMGYVTKEVTFLATGTSTTLQFSSTTSPSGWGPVIDKVDVESCLVIVCLH
jgi:choice-of-anchor C domain-containing protein